MNEDQRRRAETLNNQGLAAARAQKLENAAAFFQQAMDLAPDDPRYPINLGAMFNQLNRPQEAIALYRQLIARHPDFVPAHYNLSGALRRIGDLAGACASLRRVVALEPQHWTAWRNLGADAFASGDLNGAKEAAARALALDPPREQAEQFWRARCSYALYDPTMTPAARFDLHREWNQRFPAAPPRAWTNPPLGTPPRRLRIGVLSSDLRDQHPFTKNYGPIFQALDRAAFDLYAYALNDKAMGPGVSEAFAVWRDVRKLSDAAVAERIRADAIDILILPCGHFDENRPLVAQHRPAPLVVGAGDDAMNLDGFDYFITNAAMTPRGNGVRTTERPLRPPSFYIHAPPSDAPNLTPVPEAQAFIATHNPSKLSDAVWRVWGDILRRAPAATLSLRYKNAFQNPALQARVRERMGADVADRLRFGGATSYVDHLRDLSRHCVMLDSFPFTGATAVFEALWMGVPVAAMRGRTWHERMSSGLLAQIGLSDLSAATPAEYVALAVALIQDRARLNLLRRDLRDRLTASSLCQPQKTARWFDRLFHAIWRRFEARRAEDVR